MYFSKSKYTRGIQCPKALWLQTHTPDILTPPDSASLARLETGHKVGRLARSLFPGGREINTSDMDYEAMADETAALLHAGTEFIYEATFLFDGMVVMVDILQNTPDGLILHEVKSSTETEEIHLHDLAFQKYVIENCGLTVSSCNIVHIDNTYVRGTTLDVHQLFISENVTDSATRLCTEVPAMMQRFETILENSEYEPDTEIGKQCKKPHICDAVEYCWKQQRGIPDYSVFNIFNMGSKKLDALYSQGIVRIVDIPDDYEMTDRQKQKVVTEKYQQTHIDRNAIRSFLDTLTYPVYHLDFETFQQAVPQWEGVSPYQQIPFQYSLHIQYEDGGTEHKEFLAVEGEDPRRALAERLVTDIPTDVTVLAYNMSFEKGVIRNLALLFPDLAVYLEQIHDNILDLMVPFQKQWYVTPAMQGSHSIKYVFPALVPSMANAYRDLEHIHNGSEAMHAYAALSDKPSSEKEVIRNALKAYCKLDTLSMVEILNVLKQVSA